MTDADPAQHVLEAEDGHKIHVQVFEPATTPCGIIHVLHGLGEHAGRYARFAAAAGERRYAVVAHDHRGHGGHLDLAGSYGAGGWHALIADTLAVHAFARTRFPDLPLTLLGHSMGSYLAQSFTMVYGDRLQGLLLSGSTWPSKPTVAAAHLLSRIECWRVGAERESALLDTLGFSSFNRAFKPSRTELDWLSRDEKEVDKYIADPLCGGPFTAGLWRDLTGALLEIGSDTALMRIPSDLPILISGGEKDPVGGEKALGKLALHYAQTRHQRMKVKIYPDGRHELLNETNRDEVTRDWLDWIDANTQPKANPAGLSAAV